jgi:hypothetical protein
MISSVQTRVIVSARGAYTVGNLDALVEAMSAEQRITYRVAVIRQVLGVFKGEIARRALTNPALQDFLAAMDRWLAEPTDANAASLIQHINSLENNIPLEFGLQKLAFAVGTPKPDFPRYVRGIIAESGSLPALHTEVLNALITQWQLEAAWAVMRRSAIPPEPASDSAALEGLLGNAHWCYEKRLLNLLVQHFTLAQWVQFRNAILHQAVWLVDHGLPPDRVSPDYRVWVDQAQHWLDQPAEMTKQVHQQAMWAVGQFRRRSAPTSDALAMLVTLFDPDAVPQHQALHDATIVTIIASIFAGPYADNSTVEKRMLRRETAHQWQIEAAWAIYNNEPIPAFMVGNS